ncbi:MAG TPA: hypothetical protein VEQ63_14305, partial [Bryobacteraceae bacterium]|nr:hypothetical protein [Bryobacteraceae bacterium]
SDPGPIVDGIEQITDDLRLLLRTARIQTPYVVVGASLGCIYARTSVARRKMSLVSFSSTALTTKASRLCGIKHPLPSAC